MTPTKHQINTRLEAYDWLIRSRPVSKLPVSEVLRDIKVLQECLDNVRSALKVEITTDGSLSPVTVTPSGHVPFNSSDLLCSLTVLDANLHVILASLGFSSYLYSAHAELHFSLSTATDPATHLLRRTPSGSPILPPNYTPANFDRVLPPQT